MNTGIQFFPDQASDFALRVDLLYVFLLAVTGFFTLLIAGLILFFAVYYRRRQGRERTAARENMLLEVVWSIVPLVLALSMFSWGAWLFLEMHDAPADAEEINVVGKQWMWKIQHPGGRREINQLHIPVGRAVKLRMISEDVIHSFYVPAFRVKQDVLPGRYTTMWFRPTREGAYHLFCAEYCGASHAQMGGQVIVMSERDYADWLARRSPDQTTGPSGEALFHQFRCHTCHHEGSDARGPSLRGLYGGAVPLDGGGTAVADEDYLRESVYEPQSKVVAGYRPLMPTYHGQIGEEQMLRLIAYIKSLESPSESKSSSEVSQP
ncbi:MAG: cytochrome c oxidase subunit II [Pirellulaceae bacterium]